jgi:hypothetical protein
MKNKLLVTIMLLSLATSILAFTMQISPANAAPNEAVRVYIDPPLVNKVPTDVNSFFDVFVTIEKVTNLFGFDIRVSWDNSLLTLDSAEYNATLDALWGAGHWQVLFNETYGGGGGGGGGYKLVALSTLNAFTLDPGSQVLFPLHFKIIKSCNFILETPFYFDLVKLSDNLWQPIPHTTTNGLYHMGLTVPDLEFELVNPDILKPFEYCKTFQVKVYVTHICANLKDYNLVILYDTELLKLTGVDWTDGVLGGPSDGASSTELPPGTITVVDTGGIVWNGDQGLLFTLTFHIEFDQRIEHIWQTNNQGPLHAFIKFTAATLSFNEGDIGMSGITMPLDLDIVVNLIRGDVDCDGNVDVFDLRTIAAGYDKTSSDPEWTTLHYWSKYDLTNDGTIDIFDLVAAATKFGYGGP